MSWDPSKHPRAADGKFGTKSSSSSSSDGQTPAATTAEIKDFQKKYGLPVTGKFDPATLSAMQHAHDKPGKKPKAKKPKAKKATVKPKKTTKKTTTAQAAGGKGMTLVPGKPTKTGTKTKKAAKKPVAKQHAPRPPKKVVRKVTISGRTVH